MTESLAETAKREVQEEEDRSIVDDFKLLIREQKAHDEMAKKLIVLAFVFGVAVGGVFTSIVLNIIN